MKKLFIVLLLISFLLQSCYSYKTVDLTSSKLVDGKHYKIKINDKFTNSKLISSNDSIMNFRIKNLDKQIKISEIEEIKARKFSVLKTVALVPITYAGITAVYFVVLLATYSY